jgi:membrane protease subunit (stomatin/prohibitin family)
MLDIFKKQFIEVIEWTEETDGILSHRFPTQDKEIKNGAQLTVRDSQIALFINEGNIADAFTPGRYSLTTQNLPILTTLLNWDKAFKSPFKSEVYFFSTREKIDQRWGTQTPISIRDKELGVLRIRAFGTFSYQIEDATTFYQKISGTRQEYSVSELDGQLRSLIITTIATKLGQADTAFLDMAANQQKFSEQLKKELDLPFLNYGLKLCSFFVQSVTLPEELQAYLDKKSQMNLVGDLQKYATFQAADSISKAAENPSGMASAGVGMGMGSIIGQALAGASQSLTESSTKSATKSSPDHSDLNNSSEEDVFEKLEKLHSLISKGIITQEEFDLKKAELLKRIG